MYLTESSELGSNKDSTNSKNHLRRISQSLNPLSSLNNIASCFSELGLGLSSIH
jgi:hypothetical protein